jgi:spore maturation protein CgeB
MLPRDAEASLYRQAKVCPVINEFTVELMRGQINERVFKVLGSMGCPVVDAVSTYRELYSEDELLVSKGSKDFVELVNLLLKDNEMNQSYREKGYQATLNRHTYEHRALDYLSYLNLSMSENLF